MSCRILYYRRVYLNTFFLFFEFDRCSAFFFIWHTHTHINNTSKLLYTQGHLCNEYIKIHFLSDDVRKKDGTPLFDNTCHSVVGFFRRSPLKLCHLPYRYNLFCLCMSQVYNDNIQLLQ